MLRREFLRCAAAGALVLPLASRTAWAVRNPESNGKRLVVVFLRGAVDGLNVVAPYTDPLYAEARPTIALGAGSGIIDLDGQFGLHPALATLAPFWNERSLAFVHAAGSPDGTRSHFDAQDYMESGTPGVKSTGDGWMNRLLATLPGTRQSTDAVAFGPTLPRILSGAQPVANVALGRAANAPSVLDRPIINAAFDQLYAGDDPLSRAYREGVATHRKVVAELQTEMMAADNGAPPPIGFDTDTRHLAQLIKQDPSIDLAFFALGGWDTHINQGAAEGQLATHLKGLGEGLAALAHDLGPAYADTVVMVISEFGRTVRENGNHGTDHGHGNVIWLMGGPIAGGKVYGAWPGLEANDLYENRDLAVTTDFRSVAAMVLANHLRRDDANMRRVFPGFAPSDTGLGGLIRA
jgi:uncharacterized protein (DUF1501 family)